MKQNILLVNCYRDEAEQKIAGYHTWLKAGAAAAGVRLTIHDAADGQALPGKSGVFRSDRFRVTENGCRRRN